MSSRIFSCFVDICGAFGPCDSQLEKVLQRLPSAAWDCVMDFFAAHRCCRHFQYGGTFFSSKKSGYKCNPQIRANFGQNSPNISEGCRMMGHRGCLGHLGPSSDCGRQRHGSQLDEARNSLELHGCYSFYMFLSI